MTVEKLLRMIGGFFVLLSVLLAVYHNINWLWFTGFVGANLFQSGFTNWCPMVAILKGLGVKSCCDTVGSGNSGCENNNQS